MLTQCRREHHSEGGGDLTRVPLHEWHCVKFPRACECSLFFCYTKKRATHGPLRWGAGALLGAPRSLPLRAPHPASQKRLN